MKDTDDDAPEPTGELSLQVVALPADTNATGDIYGGWLVSQMDMAGAIAAQKIARGRVATVVIESMVFLTPVHVGAVVSCYTEVKNIGRSSIQVLVEVWITHKETFEPLKVTEGDFTFVAIDDKGRTRVVNSGN